jgi:diaminopimelate epimerase
LQWRNDPTVKIEFTKASGAGNDFVIVDDHNGGLRLNRPLLARRICSRYFGVGADGLLVLQKSQRAHFGMEYFNADGSYGGMCGNGARCIARYAFEKGIAPAAMTFDALDYDYEAVVRETSVRLTMKRPRSLRRNVMLGLRSGEQVVGTYVDTGSPHVVLFTDTLEAAPVVEVGKEIRHMGEFLPNGTNVNFVQVNSRNRISIRTYERGVEAETLACGTGSVAAAIANVVELGGTFPTRVRVRSGEELIVDQLGGGKHLDGKMTLEGSAHLVFVGVLSYSDANGILDVHEREE